MQAVKTIDVKGLEHGEREQLIFPSIETLTEGQSVRLVLEFNPLPLIYMIDARDEFEVSYEKEGPAEWILRITRSAPEADNKERLKAVLSKLKLGQQTEEIKNQAKEIFQSVDAKTIGLLEQELIEEGISREEVRRSLCDIHLEVLRDSLVAKRIEVSSPHPVHTFMQEHQEILANLKELEKLVERLEAAVGFSGLEAQDLEQLKQSAHHLVEAESHHQREEEVLFSRLQKHDITEPVAIMTEDHVELRKRKQRLFQIAQDPKSHGFTDFRREVLKHGEYLTRELESHIFKEDNILYQIALQVLEEKEWDEVKKDCDKIGYCCFTPTDQKSE